jgi:putative ABC transport system ATP-binding protein
MPKIIEIRDLYKIFKLSEEVHVKALNGVSLDISRGEYLSIMGSSGSGKSTFMNILGFLDTPTSGTYFLDGIDGSSLNKDQKAEIRNRKIGFVFQGFNLLSRTSALENVEMPLFYKGGVSAKELRQRAKELLGVVGLSGREEHHPNRLSGGEQQRVAIARAVVTDPAILVADEPTGDLDRNSAEEILNMMGKLSSELSKTIIMVTHDPRAAQWAHVLRHLEKGYLLNDNPSHPV